MLAYSSCDDEKKSSSVDWSERYNSRLRVGTKMFKIFIKVCGPEFIPNEQLEAAENCSFKKLLVRNYFAFRSTVLTIFRYRTKQQ